MGFFPATIETNMVACDSISIHAQIVNPIIDDPLNFQSEYRGMWWETERDRTMSAFLGAHPGPTIVYAALPEQVESLADRLRAQGMSIGMYHEGMTLGEQANSQDAFVEGRVDSVSQSKPPPRTYTGC